MRVSLLLERLWGLSCIAPRGLVKPKGCAARIPIDLFPISSPGTGVDLDQATQTSERNRMDDYGGGDRLDRRLRSPLAHDHPVSTRSRSRRRSRGDCAGHSHGPIARTHPVAVASAAIYGWKVVFGVIARVVRRRRIGHLALDEWPSLGEEPPDRGSGAQHGWPASRIAATHSRARNRSSRGNPGLCLPFGIPAIGARLALPGPRRGDRVGTSPGGIGPLAKSAQPFRAGSGRLSRGVAGRLQRLADHPGHPASGPHRVVWRRGRDTSYRRACPRRRSVRSSVLHYQCDDSLACHDPHIAVDEGARTRVELL